MKSVYEERCWIGFLLGFLYASVRLDELVRRRERKRKVAEGVTAGRGVGGHREKLCRQSRARSDKTSCRLGTYS